MVDSRLLEVLSRLAHLAETWEGFAATNRNNLRSRIRRCYRFCALEQLAPISLDCAKLYEYLRFSPSNPEVSVTSAPQYLLALTSLQNWLGYEQELVFDSQVSLLLAS